MLTINFHINIASEGEKIQNPNAFVKENQTKLESAV